MRTRRPAIAWLAWPVALAFSVMSTSSAAAQREGIPKGTGHQLWAMLIGIQQYEESLAFPRCRGAAADAAALARWLIDTAGWGPDHVLLLSDRDLTTLGFTDPTRRPEYRLPTKANLDWGARQWLAERAKPGDVLVIFFAGQAVGLMPRPDEPPGRPHRDYLLPLDVRAANVDTTGWALGDAIDELAARGRNPIVCLLDTSPAGRIRSPVVLGEPPRVAPGERFLKGISRWQGVTTWIASTVKQSGQTRNGEGLLTKALLEVLGTRLEPCNLQACLDRLRRDPALAKQGFQTLGGFEASLTLWPARAVPGPRRDPPILQRGHADRVTAVAFSADGSRMITASMDSTLRSWHAESGTLLRIWPFVTNGFRCLALSGDGQLLVAGGGNGDVRFFDLQRDSEKSLVGPIPHTGGVDHVAILPVPGRFGVADPKVVYSVLTVDNKGRSLIWDASEATVRRLSLVSERGGRLPAVATLPGRVALALVVSDRTGIESIRTFDFRGERIRDLPPPPGRISAMSLDGHGSRLWAGTEKGILAEFDLEKGDRLPHRTFEGAVTNLRTTPLALVVAAGASIHVLPWNRDARDLKLAMDRPIARLAVSANGRYVAACDPTVGSLRAWEIDVDGASARALDLDQKSRERTLSIAFSPGGDRLISGDGDGGIRTWELPSGQARQAIPASRGRVRHLAVSPDEKMLLQVTEDGIALVWDFAAGRGTRRVPGFFTPAGVFLPSGDLVLIDQEGEIVLHDRATLARRPLVFEHPPAENSTRPSRWPFSSLALASDGRVAGASREGPLACVWKCKDGRLTLRKPIRDHRGGITAVSFSGDGQVLLTAGDDGLAKLWDISGGEPKLERVLGQEDPVTAGSFSPVTVAALSPVAGGPIVMGRQDGRVEVWNRGATQPSRVGRLDGHVRTVAFSADGKLIAAGGDDRQIMLRAVGRLGQPIPLGTGPNHFEMINQLVFWPGGRLLASASDDTTVRLWRLARPKLMGTLSAAGDGGDWVVFTPEGLFDASSEGERRVSWWLGGTRGLGDGLPARLEQYRERRHVFDLADILSRGEEPKEPEEISQSSPPQIIVEPVSPPSPKQRRVNLKIRVSEEGISDLRLYQNGVAVQGDLKRHGKTMETSVVLVSGPNRIYALAGRPGSIDGRSNQLDLVYDGQTPGRTHILALGVSRYQTQALQFADKDARAVAGFLRQKKLEGNPPPANQPIVLVNDEVSWETVTKGFQELRRRVRGRPEDTVIVFLAGHTDVRQGYFCLLLPTAILPDGPPIVALRGPAGDQPRTPQAKSPIEDSSVLPYGMIHNNLAYLDALNRLVIIDACQAEALFDDPRVRTKVRRTLRGLAEREAHVARTSYILATRRGEREQAAESELLEHGLLTYTLLRGMGETGLRKLKPNLPIFTQYPTADLDRDGWVATGELRQYSEMIVPMLIERYPELVLRGPRESLDRNPRAALSQDSEASSSFPLIEAPAP
jgi:WD40 repeat protein/uncharacterized caspase-like protein